MPGNFRGVCPILNRAKEMEHMRILRPCVQRRSDPLSGIVCDPSNAGFIMCREETHGRL